MTCHDRTPFSLHYHRSLRLEKCALEKYEARTLTGRWIYVTGEPSELQNARNLRIAPNVGEHVDGNMLSMVFV